MGMVAGKKISLLLSLISVLRVLFRMIVCPLCSTAVREDSRFCDMCGVQLETPRHPKVQYYPPLAYQPDLVQQAVAYVVQALNQLDLSQKMEVLDIAAELLGGAYWARLQFEKWQKSRRIQGFEDSEP